jgi:hypothetical protein
MGSLSGWVVSGFFARSSLMFAGAAEGVRSDVVAWLVLGGGPSGELVKALLIVLHTVRQRAPINHRVSVVLPDYRERLTF